MFSSVSWKEYLIFITIVVAIYYTILLVYYRMDLSQILSGSKNLLSFNKAVINRNISEETIPMMQSLLDEVNAYLNEAAQSDFNKEEILMALRFLIGKYPALLNAAHRSSIENLIVSACESYCSLHLDESELNGIWTR